MSFSSRGLRIALLMAGAAGVLYWITHHAEVSFADGLRYVREAERIAQGDFAGGLIRAIDHPVHSLSIAAVHGVIGGDHPHAWQKAAQLATVLALMLAIVPIYLMTRDVFDDETAAALGCLLVIANPVVSYIAVNVLSESTFLLFWMWGLWASVRFLREGRFLWLPAAIGCGALAYLTRPEGLLLHAALAATLLLLPLHPLTRIHWPRWWAALGLLVLGPAILIGPYVAIKGGLGTKPAVARVIGTLPESAPLALERETPRPTGQTQAENYAIATNRMIRAFRGAITVPLIPLAILGLIFARPAAGGARMGLFFGIIVVASAIALVRLHATGGYCTVRHALVPGMLFVLAAANGVAWLIKRVSIPATWLGLGEGRLRPGPAVWAGFLALIAAAPVLRTETQFTSSFTPYRLAGLWLAEKPDADGRILDLTDWALFFSGRAGSGFDSVTEPQAQAQSRWLILREAHLRAHHPGAAVARQIVAGREPVARFPENPGPNQLQVLAYDLATPTRPELAEAERDEKARR